MGRKYGYMPKMRRIQIVHELLWYLVYGYEGVSMDDMDEKRRNNEEDEENSSTSESATTNVESVTTESPTESASGSDLKGSDPDEPDIYLDCKNWRRYLPPLPVHRGE